MVGSVRAGVFDPFEKSAHRDTEAVADAFQRVDARLVVVFEEVPERGFGHPGFRCQAVMRPPLSRQSRSIISNLSFCVVPFFSGFIEYPPFVFFRMNAGDPS